MYAYPGHVSEKLAETMARHPQVVHYLDVPMQHGAAGVLRRMRRPSPEVARRMLERLRGYAAGAADAPGVSLARAAERH
jgi:ribosomal protein S12 methylthiotransferase